MELTTAVLCDFAQVRDRLLFVASGAVTRIYRAEVPAEMGVMLGVVVDVPLPEAGMDHEMIVQVVNRFGQECGAVRTVFRVGSQGIFPNEIQQVPMAVALNRVPLRTWGTHQVRITLGDHVRALTFYVVPASGTRRARPAAERAAQRAAAPPADTDGGEPAEPAAQDAAEPPRRTRRRSSPD